MIIEVIVKTNSKKGPLLEKQQGTNPPLFTAYLRAKPHDDEANRALIELLSEHFKTRKTAIKILSGQKSHHKRLQID